MRIVHVIDYFHTDVGYQEYFLAREQARAGHPVRVVTSMHRHHTVSTPITDETDGDAELARAGVDVVRLRARQLGHDRAWLTGLNDAIATHEPDVAHVHGPFSPTTVRATRSCAGLRVPVLVDNHIQEAIAPGSVSPAGRLYYTLYRVALGRWLRRHVSTWVANGPYEADFLRDRMGLCDGDVQLVPLAFDPDVFRYDDVARTAARQAHGWGDELVVTVTGKLHPGKCVEVVAAAAEQRARDGNVRVVLAGSIEPSYLAEVRAAAPTLAAGERIEVYPLLPQKELAALYLASDVVVFARLPSISIYEAAGTGARVLVGRDRFADWLHQLDASIEPVDLAEVAESLAAADNRATRAADAAEVLGWPAISALFVDLYKQMSCAS